MLGWVFWGWPDYLVMDRFTRNLGSGSEVEKWVVEQGSCAIGTLHFEKSLQKYAKNLANNEQKPYSTCVLNPFLG